MLFIAGVRGKTLPGICYKKIHHSHRVLLSVSYLSTQARETSLVAVTYLVLFSSSFLFPFFLEFCYNSVICNVTLGMVRR